VIGDARAEIALNILSFLISLSYATIIKIRCPPASPEPRDGGQAPGVLNHVMGRGIERIKIFIEKRYRKDFITRLSALAEGSSMDIYARALLPNHFLC